MNAMQEIAEARASALSLRASAQACGREQGPLKFRLMRAAESLDGIVVLAVRGLERIAALERQLMTATASGNSITIAEGSALNSNDCELILRALDVLDRLMQAELANKKQDAAAGETRSRILIVRAKVHAMQVSP